jgi:aspartyl-tRNA(Asn)/glutamyl-tRNA(Gln) amidotransferase subunit B
MTQSLGFARCYEALRDACRALPVDPGAAGWPKLAANWLMGEISRRLNAEGRDIGGLPLTPVVLAALIGRVADGTVSNHGAKQVLDVLWAGASDGVDALIERLGLKQLSDSAALDAIVEQVLAANPKSVAEYRAGKDKAFNALVGQVMKATQGKANPAQAGELLRRRLA